MAYLPLWIRISDLYDQAGTMTLHQSLLLLLFILQTFFNSFVFYVSFVCNFLYIFSIDFISAFSTFFSCIQTIVMTVYCCNCNDSLLLFSSQKQYNLHIHMSGLRSLYISLSLDLLVCQFVRFLKLIPNLYWKKIILYTSVRIKVDFGM